MIQKKALENIVENVEKADNQLFGHYVPYRIKDKIIICTRFDLLAASASNLVKSIVW